MNGRRRTRVHFTVDIEGGTRHNEFLMVVGSDEQLGNWNSEKAMHLVEDGQRK